MKRLCSALLLTGVVVLPARAQVVWVLPGGAGEEKPAARLIFSDKPEAGKPGPLAEIGSVEVFVRGRGGEAEPVKYTKGKDALLVPEVGSGLWEVIGLGRRGVAGDGQAPAALVHYYAKTYVGLTPPQMPPLGYLREWRGMQLEVVSILDQQGFRAQAVWRGRPLARCAYTLFVPGKEKPVEGRANADGLFWLEESTAGGQYGICLRHVEARAGEYKGKKYKEVRHYSTITFPVLAGLGLPRIGR
jgi:hypothetical protein